MLRKIYHSPLGPLFSILMNIIATFARPFMVYGHRDRPSGSFRKHTRISSSAVIGDREHVSIGDHVWIGHYNVLDGSSGIVLGRGCQLAANVSIFTHGSQMAVRLYGDSFISTPHEDRTGYTRGQVCIGEFTFVGAGSTIMPGVTLGRGCLVSANSLVTKSAPDYAILRGSPAKIVGDVRTLDEKYLEDSEIRNSYFDQSVVKAYLAQRGEFS